MAPNRGGVAHPALEAHAELTLGVRGQVGDRQVPQLGDPRPGLPLLLGGVPGEHVEGRAELARGALADVRSGRLTDAVTKVRKVWASLPGANYSGQGMRSMSYLQAAYVNAGGTITL